MRIILFFLLILIAVPAAGCLPVTSRAPVGASVPFHPVPLLLGTWKASAPDGDAPAYLHILANENGTMTAILVTSPTKDNPGDWSTYTLRAATLGENPYINAQEAIVNGKPSDGALHEKNVILLYRPRGARQITLYQMDDKAAAETIRHGEIRGEIEPGEDGDVEITAGEPELDAFMKTPKAGKLFSKVLVTLTRIE